MAENQTKIGLAIRSRQIAIAAKLKHTLPTKAR
jgi:hypothetical protein